MNTSIITKGTWINRDDFKDIILHASDSSTLQKVLTEVFHGKYFAFTSHFSAVIDNNACACTGDEVVCEKLIEAVNAEANSLLRHNLLSDVEGEDDELEEYAMSSFEKDPFCMNGLEKEEVTDEFPISEQAVDDFFDSPVHAVL